MPCGGIYPYEVEGKPDGSPWGFRCYHCGSEDPVPDHFVEEWDALIHGACVEAFLTTSDGRCILAHGHGVYVARDGELICLYEERPT